MFCKKILSLIGFPRVVYQTRSEFNGCIKVISVFGRYSISVDNLTQSGSIVESLWKSVLKRVKKQGLEINDCLILGVAGGTVVKVLRNYYPKVKITGVDIDPKMFLIGRKYFKLDSFKIKKVTADAFAFVEKAGGKYDLVIVDLFVGKNLPDKFSKTGFFRQIDRLLEKPGLLVFNCLRFSENKENKLLEHVKEAFPKTSVYQPLVNTVIFCQK